MTDATTHARFVVVYDSLATQTPWYVCEWGKQSGGYCHTVMARCTSQRDAFVALRGLQANDSEDKP